MADRVQFKQFMNIYVIDGICTYIFPFSNFNTIYINMWHVSGFFISFLSGPCLKVVSFMVEHVGQNSPTKVVLAVPKNDL